MLDSPRTLSDALRLDRQFQKSSIPELQAVYEVEQRVAILNRQAAVRVRHWLHHLSLPTENLTWKRNRNQHCHILLQQLGKGRLTQPFDREPADGPVGNLPSHVLAEYKASLRSRSGRKLSQILVHASPASGCVPKPSLSEPPLPYSGKPSPSKQVIPSAAAIHRRSVSAQASFDRHQDAQSRMARRHHSQSDLIKGLATSSTWQRSQVQHSLGQPDTPNIQHSAGCGCSSIDAAQNLHACDMHQKVQQCRNLLEQRMHASKTRLQQSCCTQHHKSKLHSVDLGAPDIQVHLKGVQPREGPLHSTYSPAKECVKGIGQITQYEPPFLKAPSASPYRKSTASLARLQSITNDVRLAVSCPQEVALPRSHSSASSSDDTRMASSICSTESSGSKLDLSGSPEMELKSLSVHPDILRAHLDKIQLAEQDMLQSCTARTWQCAKQHTQ